MFGTLNLNKPVGVTSRDVVNIVQRIVKPVKVGHAGTLDPLATGVLVVCLGKATKLISLVQQAPKSYVAVFTLGQRSDTDDSTGVVNEVPLAGPPPSYDQVTAALQSFVGTIDQIPPAYSAAKIQGQRAYARARRGEEVTLQAKQVTIHGIELLDFRWPQLTVRIECGSGTYIRSIARDLGEQLGCGGLMSALERTAIGAFFLRDAVDAETLSADNLRQSLSNPVHVVADMPQYRCPAADEPDVALGRGLPERTSLWHRRPTSEIRDGLPLALTSADGSRLLAIAEYRSEPRIIQPRTVLMD